MTKSTIRPYLITKDEDGLFRITVRTTRFNSQGYPLVSSEVMDGSFPTLTTARIFVRQNLYAETTDISIK